MDTKIKSTMSMESRYSEDVFFEPWVGKNYATSNAAMAKKVLVLGDSHYCESYDKCKTKCGTKEKFYECRTFTTDIINEYFESEDKPWKHTLSTFINSFYGRNTNVQERDRFYESIAFYNFLQVAAGTNAYSANMFEYRAEIHLNALKSVLHVLSPDIVIVWGNRTWNSIPNDLEYGDMIAHETHKNIYSCPFMNKKITLVGVHHPCRGYSRDYYYNIFRNLGIALA